MMTNKNLQIFICAIRQSGAKHYLSLGRTTLRQQDLRSFFTNAPTPAILKALDGMQPAQLVWVELERVAEKSFSARSQRFCAAGIYEPEQCRMNGSAHRIGEMADIIVDDIRRAS